MKTLLSLLLLCLPLLGQSNLPPAPSQSKIEKRIFWITNGVVLPASVVYDVEVTHQGLAHHKCVEGNELLAGHPSRGQLYLENGGIALGVMGLDYLFHRAGFHWGDNAAAGVLSVIHFQAGSTWFTHGCY